MMNATKSHRPTRTSASVPRPGSLAVPTVTAIGIFATLALGLPPAAGTRWSAEAAEQGSTSEAVATAVPQVDAPLDFSRDIRPILSDACFACHGPDESHREADLRLDLPGGSAIVAGDLAASELWARIRSDDAEQVMPPPHTGKRLDEEEIALIGRWIEQGAAYSEHWAFLPPRRLPLPATPLPSELAGWSRGAIDGWVLDALVRNGLAPSPPADPQTLLRRLHLDLIGLPPTPADIERFVNDPTPEAYEREVDRLLDSVHFGERWGRVWLDAARYADSDGFEKDKPRSVWFYRDWVVRALNADLPYDQFVIKQIAGDRLPDATQEDHVATGFLRNSMINEEGGVDPEQFRMEAMFDRMDAIGKSMLGLTIQCAQCHSHKYDPLSHTDYYGLLALINNCHEASVTVFSPEEQAARQTTLARIDELVRTRLAADGDWLSRLIRWQVQAQETPVSEWQPVAIDFNPESIGGQKFLRQTDGSYLAAGYAPTKFRPTGDVSVTTAGPITAVRIELLSDPNLPHGGPGRSVDGTWALSELELQVPKLDDQGKETWEKVAWSAARATIDLPPSPLPARYADKTETVRTLGPVAFAIDGDPHTAWHGNAGAGRRNEPQTAMFRLATPIAATGDTPLRFRIQLSQNHGGWNSDDNQTHNLGRFRVSVTEAPEPSIAPLPPRLMAEIGDPMDKWSEETSRAIIDRFIREDELLRDLVPQLDEAWRGYPEGTSQLVLVEREQPRTTHRLERGNFLSPREVVAPGLPAWLGVTLPRAPSSQQPLGRLDLAHWIASPTNPLTARSIVNRIWQEYFGAGLVATSDDLGMQGEAPSHPQLLDQLAVDLMESGWSLKALHRQIVLSTTYRQDSSVTPERLAQDPRNRWLSRGSRVRVPAETFRDLVLAAAGLLDPQVGGPPVYPPAPEFLFRPPASYGPKSWGPEEGSGQHRRALYAFRFRSVPYPVLETFDAPNGDVACVRRSISNTPLQALVSLNEPVFLEAARGLAVRALAETRTSAASGRDDAVIEQVFVALTGRVPQDAERGILREMLTEQRSRLAADPAAARAIAGEAIAPAEASELAAWTLVSRVVMNLDETITKP